MRFFFLTCALTLSVALTSCAAPNSNMPLGNSDEIQRETIQQQVLVLDRGIAETERVMKVAYPLLKANTELCPKTRMDAGYTVWSIKNIPSEYESVASSRYALGKAPKIQLVMAGSPAFKSGLKSGDTITAINGEKIQNTSDFDDVNEKFEKQQEITVGILRGDKALSIPVVRQPACDMDVVYQMGDSNVNAYADGDNIYITRGMLRFTETDNELAIVIGHEAAHNVMLHSDKKVQNAAGGMLLGALLDVAAAAGGVNTQGTFTDNFGKIGAGAYSVDFEQEADYVGLYLTKRGGYSVDSAPNFWRRMAAENDAGSITLRSSHPTSPERFVALEKTLAEINAKQSKGQKLLPNSEPQKPATISKKAKNSFN